MRGQDQKEDEEQECGRRSDTVRILALELLELVDERWPHLHGEASHDVLDQGLGEGDTVEISVDD